MFARVNTVFYETMSKAQGNYKITEVWVVVNRPLKEKYEEKKNEFKSVGKDVSEIFAFHGSGRDSIMGISKTNFLPPDRLPKADDGKKKKGSKYKGKGKGNKDTGPKVTVLDDGYFTSRSLSFSSPHSPFFFEKLFRQRDLLFLVF